MNWAQWVASFFIGFNFSAGLIFAEKKITKKGYYLAISAVIWFVLLFFGWFWEMSWALWIASFFFVSIFVFILAVVILCTKRVFFGDRCDEMDYAEWSEMVNVALHGRVLEMKDTVLEMKDTVLEWHTADEKPEKLRKVIIQFCNLEGSWYATGIVKYDVSDLTGIFFVDVLSGNTYAWKDFVLLRWAYLD